MGVESDMKLWPSHHRSMSHRPSFDVDEIFMDSFQLKGREFRWEQRLERLIGTRPIRLVTALIVCLLGLFIVRAAYLNTVEGSALSAQARDNSVKELWQRSPRGIIYDRTLRPLVSNVSTFDLVLIPAESLLRSAPQEMPLDLLAEITGTSREEVVQLLAEANPYSYQPIPLKASIDREERIRIEGTLDKIPGVRIEENMRRQYDERGIFAHVIGYASLISKDEHDEYSDYLLTDIFGKSGIEHSYEDTLRGSYGKVEVEVDAYGKEGQVLNSRSPVPGKNVVLFLDGALQEKITEVMERTLAQKGLSAGAAVAVDPRSGGVLALQSFPLYNSNLFSLPRTEDEISSILNNETRPLFNRAIAGTYPPGSTIKPFLAIAGLEENVIDEQTTVLSTDYITVGGQRFHDWRAHGVVDLRRALAVSSNIFFYTLGGGYDGREGLGPYRIKKYLELFDFAGPTHVDLPGEQAGIVPDPEWKKDRFRESWYIGDTYNMSIGQGYITVTPLSLAMATAAIANDGVLFQPRVVRAIRGESGSAVEETIPKITHSSFVSPRALERARQGMRESVLTGYNKVLQSLPVAVAGKTGTAQIASGREHAWYTVFAPYENPEVVMTFVVENGGLGTDTVVPIAQEVLDWYFREQRGGDEYGAF